MPSNPLICSEGALQLLILEKKTVLVLLFTFLLNIFEITIHYYSKDERIDVRIDVRKP